MVAIAHDFSCALAVLQDPRRAEAERARAATLLGDVGDTEAVLPLAVEYGDADGSLKTALAYALGRLNAIDVLGQKLAYGDARSRARAAEVLALFADEAATRVLVTALEDADPDVRINAAYALAEHADPLSRVGLARRLVEDANPSVRGAAAQALGEIPGVEARRALERAARKEGVVKVVILIERAIQRRIDRGEAEEVSLLEDSV